MRTNESLITVCSIMFETLFNSVRDLEQTATPHQLACLDETCKKIINFLDKEQGKLDDLLLDMPKAGTSTYDDGDDDDSDIEDWEEDDLDDDEEDDLDDDEEDDEDWDDDEEDDWDEDDSDLEDDEEDEDDDFDDDSPLETDDDDLDDEDDDY